MRISFILKIFVFSSVLGVCLLMLILANKPGFNKSHSSDYDYSLYREILIVAPHNDDEILGSGGVIQKHLSNGANVRVLMMTNGDGQYRGPFVTNKKNEIKLGYRRQKETLEALKSLGISESNVIFLGYPDRGLHDLWDNYWDCGTFYRSKKTGEDHTEHSDSFNVGAPYCGMSVVSDLMKIIGTRVPDVIYMPHPFDIHPDHWATNAFVIYSIEKLKAEYPENEKLNNIREITYLVHFWHWPLPRGKRLRDSLTPPRQLSGLDTEWVDIELQPSETDKKFNAIRMYKSQMEYMSKYLESFARRNELFGILHPLSLNMSPKFENYMSDPNLLTGNESETSNEPAPFLSYFDPRHKSIYADIRRFNDIKSLEIMKFSQKLKITVSCYQKINSANDLLIHIKSIDKTPDNRSYKFLLDGKSLSLNNEDISKDSHFAYVLESNSFTIEIPLEILHNPEKIILGAEFLRKDYSFSKSAYRVIEL